MYESIIILIVYLYFLCYFLVFQIRVQLSIWTGILKQAFWHRFLQLIITQITSKPYRHTDTHTHPWTNTTQIQIEIFGFDCRVEFLGFDVQNFFVCTWNTNIYTELFEWLNNILYFFMRNYVSWWNLILNRSKKPNQDERICQVWTISNSHCHPGIFELNWLIYKVKNKLYLLNTLSVKENGLKNS